MTFSDLGIDCFVDVCLLPLKRNSFGGWLSTVHMCLHTISFYNMFMLLLRTILDASYINTVDDMVEQLKSNSILGSDTET